jgi:hypothetical protein
MVTDGHQAKPHPRLFWEHAVKKRSSGVSLFLAALALVITTAASNSHTAAAATTGISARHTDNLQVADEITRRLRRIGVTFNRSRIPHPYDPAGEVC